MNKSLAKNRIPLLYLLIPLSIQLLIIVSVPSQSFYTYKTGKNAIIQTMPVDPYDFLRGYSQTLNYEISNLRNLKNLPGGKTLKQGDTFYLTLQAPESSKQQPPLPWTAVEINHSRPSNLSSNQIALKGIVSKYNRANYGLETYYMPENQRNKINQEIRKLRRENNSRQAFVVEIKVDRFGNSIPYSLWLGNNNYRF